MGQFNVPDHFSWPAPWKLLPLPEGWLGLVRSAEAELRSEDCPGHPLYGQVCRVVAFNSADMNEVALESYLQVRDSDFEKAVSTRILAQDASVAVGGDSQTNPRKQYTP